MKNKTWIIHLCILLVITGVVYLALESPEFALYQMKTDFCILSHSAESICS